MLENDVAIALVMLPMDNEVISHAEGDEKILSFNIPDEALERAASAQQAALTWVLTAITGTTAAGHSSVQRANPGFANRTEIAHSRPYGPSVSNRICTIIASSWRGESRRDSRR